MALLRNQPLCSIRRAGSGVVPTTGPEREAKGLIASTQSGSELSVMRAAPKSPVPRMLLAALWFAPIACIAQQPIYYPAKGQSPQQQNRDLGQCQGWAQQTTGINPAALAAAPQPQAPSGPAVGGGERVVGAARGAILGEVFGDHGGEGAILGAMIGGVRARRNQAQQQQAAQQQADSARAAQVNTYNRAVAACMEGRGYTVR